MAAAGYSTTELKRKRIFDERDSIDRENTRNFKRSSTGDSLTYIRKSSGYLPTFSQPLTPDDSSDDESMDCDGEAWRHRILLDNDVNRLSSSSISSVRVNVDDFDDDMDMNLSPIMFLTHKRPDMIMTPPRIPCSSAQSDERIPTPTASKFNQSETSIRNSFARHQMPRHTNLSPVMYEENGLPSPVASPDIETQMVMDSASDEFRGLRVECDGYVEHIDGEIGTSDIMSPRKSGKMARLHMGYRTDCEKCIQRVPGHYSHIIWS